MPLKPIYLEARGEEPTGNPTQLTETHSPPVNKICTHGSNCGGQQCRSTAEASNQHCAPLQNGPFQDVHRICQRLMSPNPVYTLEQGCTHDLWTGPRTSRRVHVRPLQKNPRHFADWFLKWLIKRLVPNPWQKIVPAEIIILTHLNLRCLHNIAGNFT